MSLEHTGAHVMQVYMTAQGYGSSPSANRDWPLFRDSLPANPNNAMCLFDTEGVPDGREMRGGRTVEHPGISLHVRSISSPDGQKKALAIYPKWDAILREVGIIEGKSYLIQAITRTTPVLSLGQEEGGFRYLFTVNGIITYGDL